MRDQLEQLLICEHSDCIAFENTKSSFCEL